MVKKTRKVIDKERALADLLAIFDPETHRGEMWSDTTPIDREFGAPAHADKASTVRTPDERSGRVVAIANYVWDSEADAQNFLSTPHPLLGNRTPHDVLITEQGARRVEKLLWKIYYGISP